MTKEITNARIARSFSRAITSEELARITSWHTLAEKRPENGQKVRFQLIEDNYSGEVTTGVYDEPLNVIYGHEYGNYASTPEHTYWMPVEEPKGLFVGLIAEHPGLSEEMNAMPTMTDALAAGDGCLHARIDDLQAHNLALLADVKDCQQQSRDYQAENAVIKSQMARLQEQVSALRNALNGFTANSCRVDWPADIYDAAIAAQKGTV